MSEPIQPPSKIHVTRVTRVTTFAKYPSLLAVVAVTRLRDFLYTPCNAAQTCNARLSPWLLRAGIRRPVLLRKSRWFRLQNSGRGIERYTLSAIGDD